MTKKLSTKKALIMSALSLLLCCSMLVGTTFAWFTDSVTSANNIIKSGNLDVELEYWDGDSWEDISGKADILTNTLWEPGVTEVAYLRVANAGSLAFKYQLGINIVSETAGVNKEGKPFLLSDYIQFGVVENVNGKTDAYETREDAIADVTGAKKISAGFTKASTMESGDELYIALVVYMPTTVGNEANYKKGTEAPQIDLGINIFATQVESESDSFDNTYDKFAAAFSVEEAEAMIAENKDVNLYNANEPKATLEIPANYTGTVALTDVTLASIIKATSSARATDDALNLVISGDVVVKATESNTSAISAKVINISGDGNLTAIANGTHAYGIGGDNTESITIKGITIDYVAGGSVQKDFINDTKYGKSEPEGGAAIGSGLDGAVITLDGVTITKAEGGSKAAAIGARYHTGVTINIKNSTIKNAVGGNASAAIGGSRVSNGATESGVAINITNSTITAEGGQFGAGIGSGYDTHCQSAQPLCTINIADSIIKATGGKYAAGIGTGFHTAALAGEIKNSNITAASGEKIYKDTYTTAQDIGFGVVDPAREGKQAANHLTVNDEKIYMPFVAAISEVPAAEIDTYTILNNNLSAESGKLTVAGGVLDGNGKEIAVTVKGSTDAAVSITGGTVKNLDIVHANHSTMGVGIGINPYSSKKLTEDLTIDGVSVFHSEDIFDRNIMYAIYAETGANNVDVVIKDSKLYGAIDVPGAATFTATNSTFGSGSYWFVALSGESSFTKCDFEGMCLLAYTSAANKTITFTNCTADGTALTAENFKSILVSTAWDYDSGLCSTNLKNCTIIIDGVEVAW